MIKWEKKICIGIPQFNGIYGITNKNKKKSKSKDIKKFFDYLKKKKIKYIDTALSYKNAENKVLSSKVDTSNFEIVTKIPKPEKKKNYENFILKKIIQSKKKFKIKKFNSILLHDCKRLNKKEILKVVEIFKILKKKKLTKHVGFSIYNYSEYKKIIKYFTPDIFQVPANIFDRTFLKKKFFNELKKNKIKLHVRSIFLQGIILSDTEFIKTKFKNWEPYFNKWQKYCAFKKISKISLATNFILSYSYIDKIIVGFQNKNELSEFLMIKKKKMKLPNFVNNNKKNIEKLTKPYNWN